MRRGESRREDKKEKGCGREGRGEESPGTFSEHLQAQSRGERQGQLGKEGTGFGSKPGENIKETQRLREQVRCGFTAFWALSSRGPLMLLSDSSPSD